MTKEKHKVLTAMFDVIPVGDSGNIDVSKITSLQSVLNLGRKFRMNKNGSLVSATKNPLSKKKRHTDIEKNKSPSEEFELFLNKDLDIKTELVSVGVEFRGEKYFKPRYRPVFAKQKPEIFNDEETDYQTVLAQINLRVPERCQSSFSGEPKKIDPFNLELLTLKTPQETHASKELDMWVKDFSKKSSDICSKKFKLPRIKMSRLSKALFLSVGFGLVSLTFFGHYGISIKNQLVIESNSAVANLQSAGENIKNMDFASASDNFAQAYKEFSKAGDDMNFMGAGISSLLSDLPGFDKLTAGGAGKLKSAKNLVEAGKLMANAGQAMSDAMGEIAKTNLILNPLSPISGSSAEALSIGEISGSLKRALMLSKKNLGKAKQFLADVDDAAIPEDKKASFEDFKLKLPVFEKLVNDSVDYSKFLEDFIGTKGIKKYLILFQNPSELRPTGGFPGTYGVVTFKDGKLQDLKVDDVYNLDGQLQELIVPPIQLQHITPNWGMRDANWFIDFPTSARKITTFFKKEAGYEVDGVITFNPQIVAQILDIVGPVEMTKYDLTLDSGNLFSSLQEEVEYKGDRKQPKQIIVDLAPRMLEKLYSAESSKWLEIFNLLVSSMERKDILMYFRDLNLESFSVDKGFSGQVKNIDSDYLMVTFSNVKGSKTDLVMDSFLKVQTTTENGNVKHDVSITRTHNGGNSEYGFYNKQNPTYIRVLVPEDSEFTGLTGNSRPEFKPLIDYTESGFKKDEDLSKFEEESYTDKETGVTIYKEAGKTEYGFWMIINPGETKTLDLEYMVPSSGRDYQLYIQKQPGLDVKDFKFYMDGKSYYDGPLEKDMIISPR
ncbi:MAG: hypothetical protein A2915_00800 [Candidatus Yanofskybacteria bacterium RIFCSPLOWO2_01_FULL_41_34]|uniref:DUF4012 domain-containing protein n=1 Tax=Candidatus Yanofskybacteria bacterium RIFCSPHIGHO2_01_FULL_41_26 TaxID=1802661 RepID=A0A1F8EC93_9BACT|nr:MAG: hypothetical protein A2649_02835 [Candidatus Yanofskybacteria bacterium RIFCSPHIGHO2_01_FULL_41_26]OGN22433.1 MAG: hypothetical protein A2915_00800 [Candidatus Yanofskybacteria bacterium RIFCSPLOWO2_01_FULL_41_34]